MPKQYSYIIVDENVSMRTIIPHTIRNYTNFLCAGYFSTAGEALTWLKYNDCDLMFLSVEMPDMNGFKVLSNLSNYANSPLTILMTVESSNYGIETHLYYSKKMIDFIFKNSGIERIAVSLDRFEKAVNNELYSRKTNEMPVNQILTIGSGTTLCKYPISQITHFVHRKNYTCFYLYDEEMREEYISLKKIEELLPVGRFVKISRNCIVMLDKIIRCEDDLICVVSSQNKIEKLTISTRKKGEVVRLMKKLNIPCY